ncbi:MAG: hypothetical protein NZ529_10265 [Cytophagaceae bacterium]|nr:hypothetical protein [Cytophagaceae bacterium]MDW8457169.1 hypothetical protein [Cytophagaceae bacterium]
MKKIFLTTVIALAVCSTLMFAQDAPIPSSSGTGSLKNKNGYDILPQANDWGLGISASATLDYFGNLMNGNLYNGSASNAFAYPNSPLPFSLSSYGGLTLLGKKVLDESNAYRVRLLVLMSNLKETEKVLQDAIDADISYPVYVEDARITKNTALMLGVGKEMRRGSHRVQGVYGGEAMIGFYSSTINYTYGNPMNINFPRPTISGLGYYYNDNFPNLNLLDERIVKEKSGLSGFIGVRPFIGVEYFFAPKISISGEFGYVLGYIKDISKDELTLERLNPTSAEVEKVIRTDNWNEQRSFGLGPENLNGSLNLLFYF